MYEKIPQNAKKSAGTPVYAKICEKATPTPPETIILAERDEAGPRWAGKCQKIPGNSRIRKNT